MERVHPLLQNPNLCYEGHAQQPFFVTLLLLSCSVKFVPMLFAFQVSDSVTNTILCSMC